MRLIVVGSGITGASCAYTASRLGADVVLVDAELPGRATPAGAGIVCPWVSRVEDQVWRDFACAAGRAYPHLIEELAGLGETDLGYRRVGAIMLASTDDDLRAQAQRALNVRATSPEMGEVATLTGAQVRHLFPPLRADVGAVHITGAARVDGGLLTAALARSAVRHGAAAETGHADLVWRSGRAAGVRVNGRLVEGDAVVAAAGAWTTSFAAPSGVKIPVTPQRGQIVHLSVAPTDTSWWPVVLPSASGHYMLAFDGSRVVVGATRETGSGFGHEVTAGGLAEVLGEALSVAPGLASATHLETRVGLRPMGPDALPLLGPVPDAPGLVVATGLGASGLTLGPHAGAIAARVALGEPAGTDLDPFVPVRPQLPFLHPEI